MLTYALISFAIAAVGGLVLASKVLRGNLASWPLSILHAGLGALGLVLVFMAILQGAGSLVQLALVILVVAALGGFFLASFHLKKKLPPQGVVVVHALVAVSGFLLLTALAFNII